MSFASYLEMVREVKAVNKGWRSGQTYFNVLSEQRADLSELIRGSEIDPFYDDDLIPVFLCAVYSRWEIV